MGGLIGAGTELAMQAYKNHNNSCDIFDIDNYDWWDVGVSAAVGVFGPGMLTVGKTAWKSGNAIKVLSSQATNTANRAAKIAGRIAGHKSGIKDDVATQAAFKEQRRSGLRQMVEAVHVGVNDSMRKIHIYIIGVVLLGILHVPVKSALPHGSVFLLIAIVYLVALRFVAERFGKP